MMRLDGLGDLAADGHNGVERSHRLLKDHGEVATPMPAHSLFRKREKGLSIKTNRSRNLSGVRQETEERKRGDGLAAARFSDQTQGLAGGDMKRHVLYGWIMREVNGQVLYFEQGC